MKRLSVLIFIALSCSVIANGALLLLARKLYADRISSQVWIGGTPSNLVTNESEASVKTTVLLLGDSRIADWGVPPIRHCRVIYQVPPRHSLLFDVENCWKRVVRKLQLCR